MKVFLLYKVSDIKNMELREIYDAQQRFRLAMQMAEPGDYETAMDPYGVRNGELFRVGVFLDLEDKISWRDMPPNNQDIFGNCMDMDCLEPHQVDRSIMWTPPIVEITGKEDEAISIHPAPGRKHPEDDVPDTPSLDSPTQGCLCGQMMKILMRDNEYILWACPPLGCGRLLLEDNKEHLGSTWYEAIQSGKPGQRG